MVKTLFWIDNFHNLEVFFDLAILVVLPSPRRLRDGKNYPSKVSTSFFIMTYFIVCNSRFACRTKQYRIIIEW